jgi:hypothetical protein
MEIPETLCHENWLLVEVRRACDKVITGKAVFISDEEVKVVMKEKLDSLKASSINKDGE